jgi:hypothetical protein
VCFLKVTAPIPFPWIEGPTTHPSSTYITLFYDASSEQTVIASGSGGEYGCGPEFWEEQDPEFKGEFLVLHKRDFRSMCEVRSYAPNKPVLWPTCSYGERCVMQVYKGWGNYDRRFWHCSLARVSYGNDIYSSIVLGFLTFFCIFQISDDDESCGFSQWVDTLAIDPYQDYINYLHDIIIYNLKAPG